MKHYLFDSAWRIDGRSRREEDTRAPIGFGVFCETEAAEEKNAPMENDDMARIAVQRVIDAPLSEIWATWDAFGDIDKFNPGVRKSRILEGSANSGLGARRQCDLSDGRNYVREEIIDYVPQCRMTVLITEGTMPLKTAQAAVSFEPRGANSTLVRFDMSFQPKMGLIGLMMVPMMKMMMRRTIVEILDGNARFVEANAPAAVA